MAVHHGRRLNTWWGIVWGEILRTDPLPLRFAIWLELKMVHWRTEIFKCDVNEFLFLCHRCSTVWTLQRCCVCCESWLCWICPASVWQSPVRPGVLTEKETPSCGSEEAAAARNWAVWHHWIWRPERALDKYQLFNWTLTCIVNNNLRFNFGQYYWFGDLQLVVNQTSCFKV